MDADYTLIETQKDLEAMLPLLCSVDRMGVDLEADSMFHFREKVCLVQIGIENQNFLLDPLSIPDLSPLGPVFADPKVRKVFHGADYDVRSLFRDFGFVLENLWDTELATRFLGHRSSGLDSVLQARFGVCLDKKYQKKDWSQRPLSKEMIAYAAGDTRYLLPLAEILASELGACGRLAWVEEEYALLQKVRSAKMDERPLFLRFKGAGRLDRRTLAVLESLLEFRLEMAEKKDKPPFKVLGGEALLCLAQERPRTFEDIYGQRVLSPRQFSMYKKDILSCIHRASALPEADLPLYPKSRFVRTSPQVSLRINALKVWRDKLAEKLKMDPALVCNKALLTHLGQRNPTALGELKEIPEMRNWQRDLLGEGILQVLAGL